MKLNAKAYRGTVHMRTIKCIEAMSKVNSKQYSYVVPHLVRADRSKDGRNKIVFSSRRKGVSDVQLLTAVGRPFQACGAAIENARSPSVDRRVVETSSVGSPAERSRRRASMSVVLCRLSVRYDGRVRFVVESSGGEVM